MKEVVKEKNYIGEQTFTTAQKNGSLYDSVSLTQL